MWGERQGDIILLEAFFCDFYATVTTYGAR